MTNIIYGVDADSDFTPKDVRDAILTCFVKAHDEILEQTFDSGSLSKEEVENLKNLDVKMLIQQFFKKIGGDFDNPTKESLINLCEKLKEFAKNFRAEDIAEKHYIEIKTLVDKLK